MQITTSDYFVAGTIMNEDTDDISDASTIADSYDDISDSDESTFSNDDDEEGSDEECEGRWRDDFNTQKVHDDRIGLNLFHFINYPIFVIKYDYIVLLSNVYI